ncbi:MAG: FadR/GntR family transcriptional regulator [Devosia sp.]|jgi:DNA-binding FadR family transcriptional regulator|nr:FadR/GntR family transcriptional regulator [Devosia sp.]
MSGLEKTAGGQPPTAAAIVAEALAQMVLTQMAPGSSLPSEGDLALRFEVSRLTVREAVKMLAGRGLLDVGRGRRAIVKEPSGIAFSDFLSTVIQNDPKGLFDLIELRMSLEVQSATLAARRATRAGILAAESAMQGMREAAEAGKAGVDVEANEERFHQHDVGFHEAVALSSGNRLISYLFEAMAAPLRRSFYLSRRGHDLRGHTVDDTIAAHDAILAAIREGNPKAAGLAMRAHLEDTERDIRSGLNAAPADPLAWGMAAEDS